MLDNRVVYLVYSLLFMVVWIALFAARKDLRRPMLLMSIAIAPLGPLSEIWYLQDYWKPVTLTGTAVGIEDVIFGFGIGGIAVALYPALANRQYVQRDGPALDWIVLAVFAAAFFACLFAGTGLLHVNSIFTSEIAFVLTGAVIVYRRPDLLAPALISGLLSFVLFTAVYFVMRLLYPPLLQAWCTGCNPSGIVLFGVNLEELLWDGLWGVCGGVLYAAVAGDKFVRRSAMVGAGLSEAV